MKSLCIAALALALVACASTGTLREIEEARAAAASAKQEQLLLEEKVVSLRAALNSAATPEELAEAQAALDAAEAEAEAKAATATALAEQLAEAEAKREREKDESGSRAFGYLDTLLAILGFGGLAGKRSSGGVA